MKNELIEYLEKEINENKLSHAFLISTNDCELTVNKIYDLLIDKSIIPNVKIENSLNTLVISDENNLIDKSKILDLQKFIITKSLNSYIKVYFIKNAEFMNLATSNKLLKVLEEPTNNVVGFLLTNDESQIISTIKSRCKRFNYNIFNEDKFDIDEEIYQKFLNISEMSFIDLYNFKKNLLNYNKIQLQELISGVQAKINDELCINNDISNLANLYKILDNITELIKKNVNIELCIDKLFIEIKKEG